MHLNLATCQLCRFASHRQQGWKSGSICTVDHQKRDFRDVAKKGDCPKQLFVGGVAYVAPPPAPAPQHWGPPLWKLLHTATGDPSAILAWVTARIPCGDCKRHWREMLIAHPPVHGAGWFEWTWKIHDFVNERLGKARPSLEESRAFWSASSQSGR